MNEKRKPAHGGNHERAAGMETAAALTGATISHAHSITEGKERQLPKLQVSDLLPHERENALKLRDLKELFSMDSRTIRSLIQRERQHVPILSDNLSGYWISDDAAEVQKFTASMRHRARQIWATAAHVEKAAGLPRLELQQLEGQETFFNGGSA